MAGNQPPVVELRSVSKRFDNVVALADVSFSAAAGKVVALVGENGAGKSTAGRIVAGLHRPDSGSLLVDGEPVRFAAPRDALRAGIVAIAQELSLAPSRSVLDNVMLGDEDARAGLVGSTAMLRRYRRLDEQIGFGIDPRVLVRDLRVADQQKVELLRALSRRARVVVLDEPTARLGSDDARGLARIVRALAGEGTTVLYVSHFLTEVLEIADQIVVLKDGRVVRSGEAAGETPDSLVTAMLGRELGSAFPELPPVPADARPVLRASDLRTGEEVQGVSLEVRAGEIVTLTGLVGSGRTETAKAIFGALPIDSGAIEVGGEQVRFGSPVDALRAGVTLLPESRAHEGLLMGRSIGENVALPQLRSVASAGLIRRRRERRLVEAAIREYRIKGDPRAGVASLSGGNQQKVLLAKWMLGGPRVLIADEPTRGVDVAAKRAIYEHILAAVEAGLGVLMISSEIEEVLGLSHRVLVFRGGQIVAEFGSHEIREDKIMRAALAA